MGGAIIRGLLSHQQIGLVATDLDKVRVEALNTKEWPDRVKWAENPEDVAAQSDVILLAVKPQHVVAVATAIKAKLGPEKLLVSIAAGLSIAHLSIAVKKACQVVRVMPNLPALIGKGVFALCFDCPELSEARQKMVQGLFELLGKVVVLPEDKFAAFTAVVGCGPAYACLFMEGMQNAAITLGFNSAQAKELVAATVEGTALMALLEPEGFADLRTQVCSPAGTTIFAVNHLERTAVRGHVTDAVLEAYKRAVDMSGQ